jgi:hypothetical protein
LGRLLVPNGAFGSGCLTICEANQLSQSDVLNIVVTS